MNVLFLFSVCIAIYFNNYVVAEDGTNETEKEWHQFKTDYFKTYRTVDEENMRKENFENNYFMIQKHNKKREQNRTNFTMKMNKFGDLNHTEFLDMFSNFCSPKIDETNHVYDYDDNLDATQFSYEWKWKAGSEVRDQQNNTSGWAISMNHTEFSDMFSDFCSLKIDETNDVYDYDDNLDATQVSCEWEWKNGSEVRDQQNNTSGWAISMVEASEIRYQIENKLTQPYLPPWSVDFVKHCSRSKRSSYEACNFLMKNKTIPTEEFYNKNKNCHVSDSKNDNVISINIKKCETQRRSDANFESIAKIIREHGPVAAAIYAAQPSFQFAGKGIYDDIECTGSPNHEVLIVGYGIKASHKYWIVQNSFGTSWGNDGFLKISDTCKKDAKNKCRILNTLSYPVLGRST